MATNDSAAAVKFETMVGVSCWMCCSIGMMVTNKVAIGIFPMECTLVAMQMVATVLAMLCSWNSLHFGSLSEVLRWCMVVPFFSGMLLTSILALKTAPMSLVITFRVLSPLAALAIERFYPNPSRITAEIIGSMMVTLLGCLLYTWDMDRSGFSGVFWVMLNSVFAVGDRLLQRLMLARDQHPVDISKTGVTLLNNLLGVIPLIPVMFYTGEINEVPQALSALSGSSYAIAVVIASCVVGIGIGYTGVWAQSLISATSFLVLVNVNKFAIIFVEKVLLKSKTLTTLQIAGCMVAIVGGVWYGKAKDNADSAAKTEETLPLKTASTK